MNLIFESQRYSTDEKCELASDSFNMRKLQFYFILSYFHLCNETTTEEMQILTRETNNFHSK